jgi:hypothetical protein
VFSERDILRIMFIVETSTIDLEEDLRTPCPKGDNALLNACFFKVLFLLSNLFYITVLTMP